jgi:hypothetical protein
MNYAEIIYELRRLTDLLIDEGDSQLAKDLFKVIDKYTGSVGGTCG